MLKWETSLHSNALIDANIRMLVDANVLEKVPREFFTPQVKDVRPEPEGNDVFARDKTKMKDYYSAWDRFDVDKAEDDVDVEERARAETERQYAEGFKAGVQDGETE